MLDDAPPLAFLATRTAAKARQFYGGLLGLPLVAEDESALVFGLASGQPLRVQKVLRFAPAHHTVFGWQVGDLAAVMRELNKAGVHFEKYAGMQQDPDGVWPAPDGTLLAWFKDPDGNLLSLSQPT
ncbi:MAG: VOC family protein [Candidatus Thermoplasmatota archaeon]|jgi:catechol 2,3-dioxygenase-like lactoylglutathione lyase family enzyme